jgi:predicted esterase
MISIEDAAESRSFLEAEGYSPQYKEYPMGHEISQEVLDDLVPWIRGVLTPAGSAPGQ